MAEEKKEEIAVIEITEEYMKERIYEIRGQRVILDSDLSEIYGYTTKAFNQQVKNNIEKFDEDFMFELTDDEVEDLRSNFLTANLNSKSKSYVAEHYDGMKVSNLYIAQVKAKNGIIERENYNKPKSGQMTQDSLSVRRRRKRLLLRR